MNRKQRRGGGRRLPPREGLIGRTDVARILQCDRSTTFRWEKDLILKAAFTEADGTRWFAREAVMQLAALMSAIANGGTLYYLQYPRSQAEAQGMMPVVKRQLDIAPLIPEIASGKDAYRKQMTYFGNTSC